MRVSTDQPTGYWSPPELPQTSQKPPPALHDHSPINIYDYTNPYPPPLSNSVRNPDHQSSVTDPTGYPADVERASLQDYIPDPTYHITKTEGVRFTTESSRPTRKASETYSAPFTKPPAWNLNYKIGSGACGTVFLEKVQMHRMRYPELWALKRISRSLPNFPVKRYQAEIHNLQALSNVSFPLNCVLSSQALVSFDPFPSYQQHQ